MHGLWFRVWGFKVKVSGLVIFVSVYVERLPP